jgi:hypothetical protein
MGDQKVLNEAAWKLRNQAAAYAEAYLAAFEVARRGTDPGNAHFAALRALDLAARRGIVND